MSEKRVHGYPDVGRRREGKVPYRHPHKVQGEESEPEDVRRDPGRILDRDIPDQTIDQERHERHEEPIQKIGGPPLGLCDRRYLGGDDGSSVQQPTEPENQQDFDQRQRVQDPVSCVDQRQSEAAAGAGRKHVFVLLDDDYYRNRDEKYRAKRYRKDKQRGERQYPSFEPKGYPKKDVEYDYHGILPVRIHRQIVSSDNSERDSQSHSPYEQDGDHYPQVKPHVGAYGNGRTWPMLEKTISFSLDQGKTACVFQCEGAAPIVFHRFSLSSSGALFLTMAVSTTDCRERFYCRARAREHAFEKAHKHQVPPPFVFSASERPPIKKALRPVILLQKECRAFTWSYTTPASMEAS